MNCLKNACLDMRCTFFGDQRDVPKQLGGALGSIKGRCLMIVHTFSEIVLVDAGSIQKPSGTIF